MWEIYYNFNLFREFNIKDSLVFSHLAEGPGGFMEASYNYRNKIHKIKKNNNDKYYGITLKPTNDYIPDWNKIKKIFNNKDNIKIEYGNLYYINDVNNYISKFNENKANLVTADGGFDYSSNFNGQEINSCQIIYSECIIALHVLKEKGCFVCKLFDLFSINMVQILYIISLCFEKVFIYKPETSRPANSEKYLICLYYKNNISNEQKIYLLKNIELWNNMELKENECIMFKNIKIDNWFIQILNEYNNKYMDIQLYYLNNILKLVENKIEKNKYYHMIKEQVNNAIDWCSKYDIEINKNSIYYKKNIE
jgi:cap1 methyltransferase